MSIFSVGGARPAIKVEPPKGKSKPVAVSASPVEDKVKPEPGLLWVILAWCVFQARVYKWQLAPAYLGLFILFASVDQRMKNGILLAICAAVLGGLSVERRPSWHGRLLARAIKRDKGSCRRGVTHLGAARPQHVFRLALVERRAAALGLMAGVAWLALTAYPMPFLLDLILLVAALSYPSWVWLKSPWRVKPPKPDPRTQLILDAWKDVISVDGPRALHGSRIIRDSVQEIPGGGLLFTARLGLGQHPSDAVSEDVRKKIEALMAPKPIGMPIDSVQLSALRDADGADRIRVTMSPTRHLELEAIEWPGIGFDKDGRVPMAQDVGGGIVSVGTYNEGSGALPFLSSGTSEMGKSNDALVHVAPGVFDPVIRETIIYIDGGGGASSAAMNKMATIVATEPAEWAAALKIAMAIRAERNRRMKGLGLDTWEPGPGSFNMITVHISEPNTVMLALPDSYNLNFGSFAQQARKAGMRWGQEPQRTVAPQILGGLAARDTVVNIGSMFIHSPGGTDNARSATDGLDIKGIENVVNALPSEPGMVVATHRKKIVSQSCRIFWAKPQLIKILDRKIAAGWAPTQLADWELEIAAQYGWTPEEGFVTEESTEEVSESAMPRLVEKSEKAIGREKIVDALTSAPGGLRAGEIVEVTGMARATVDRRLTGLVNAGDLTKDGQTYRLAELTATDIQDTIEGEAA